MDLLALLLLAIAAALAVLNAYLSFGLYLLHVRRTGSGDGFRSVSGIPLIGTLFALSALVVAPSGLVLFASAALVILDTGSPVWFVWALIKHRGSDNANGP